MCRAAYAVPLLLMAVRPAAAAPVPLSRTVTAGRAYAATPRATGAAPRPAWRVTRGPDGRPVLDAGAFLLTRVSFSRASDSTRWPAICDRFWNWNELAGRFEPGTSASAYLSGTPNCTFAGTIYFKGFLLPRIDVWPAFTVTVEGPQGAVPVPVTTRLDDRRSSDWSGIPVFLGEISTTMLADGPQRLRVRGGYRELQVDGDPATTAFEDGGDATVTFTVDNRQAATRR